MAADELKNIDDTDDYGIIHGDFWTGKYVPLVPGSTWYIY
jgi:hypothetical protein